MLETVCTGAKDDPYRRGRLSGRACESKVYEADSRHIRFVLDCMQENTTKIRNIKQYLRAVLFNAPSTIDSYYTALVAHDMAAGALGRNRKAAYPITPATRAKACKQPKEDLRHDAENRSIDF